MNSNELNVYVINLEFRTDRRVEMQRQLARIGWSATFFPAIRPDDAGDFDTIGTRGCFLSHLGVLKHAAKQDRDMVLMEDDLTFSEDFSNLWCSAYEALQTNRWSIFYPGHLLTNAPLGLHRVNPTKGLWCAHFMVIKKENIAMLADALDTMLSRPGGHPLGGPMHVDAAYNSVRAQNAQLETYIYSPVLGYQRASRSDISINRWYDNIKTLRPAINFLRRFKKTGNHTQTDDSL
jgi:glycosyl transferase family 25